MQRRIAEATGSDGGGELEALAEDYRQLEARLGHVEDELEFLRALQEPPPTPELPGTEDRGA